VATEPKVTSSRRFWRIALFTLVVLPLLPEIVVLSVSAIAGLNGCHVDAAPPRAGVSDDSSEVPPDLALVARGFVPHPGSALGQPGKVCAIEPPASGIIRLALNAGFFIGDTLSSGVIIIWLALCYLSIGRGWTSLLSRLTFAFLVTLIFAIIPYLGPMMSIEHLRNPRCQPNEAGVGPSVMYGGDVGSIVHYNVALSLEVLKGAAVAMGAFSLYALFLLIARLAAWVRASLNVAPKRTMAC
jgi:hypothetical protein